ncbi:MAG: hypothetical protein RR977_01940 [Oscillospiraceae bacterium]
MAKIKTDTDKFSMAYLTGQTFLNLFIATLMSLILIVTFNFLFGDSGWVLFLTSVVCLWLDVGMVYQFMWRQADKEANYIHLGKVEKDSHKGVKVGLLAMIPYAALDVVLALSMLKVIPFDFFPAFRLINAPLYGLMKMVQPQGGVTTAEVAGLSWGGFAIVALLPLIYLLFCAAGYELGMRHISIKQKMMYKDQKK